MSLLLYIIITILMTLSLVSFFWALIRRDGMMMVLFLPFMLIFVFGHGSATKEFFCLDNSTYVKSCFFKKEGE